MPKSFIVFNGQSSAKFGLTIEELPESNHPKRRAEPYQIEGRNGSFVHEDGVFENYEQAYAFNTRNITTGRNTYQTARDIAAWLLSSSGYCRLEDTYEPEYYRLARFAGPFNVENILRRYGRGTLSFDCRPERYLKSGEKAVTLFENIALEDLPDRSTGKPILNTTGFTARPVIRLTGRGEIMLRVFSQGSNDATNLLISLPTESNNTIVINCDNYAITAEDGLDWSSAVSIYGILDLFKLRPGENTVEISSVGTENPGIVTALEIIPRWWTV